MEWLEWGGSKEHSYCESAVVIVFTILYGRWTGPRVSQQGNLAIAEQTKVWSLYVGISTPIVKISGELFFLFCPHPILNAERGGHSLMSLPWD